MANFTAGFASFIGVSLCACHDDGPNTKADAKKGATAPVVSAVTPLPSPPAEVPESREFYPSSQQEFLARVKGGQCRPADDGGSLCFADELTPKDCFVHFECSDVMYTFSGIGDPPSFQAKLAEVDWSALAKQLAQQRGRSYKFHTPRLDVAAAGKGSNLGEGGDFHADFYEWHFGKGYMTLVQYKGHALNGESIRQPFSVTLTPDKVVSPAALPGISKD